MGANADIPSLNLLERLDLALAARAVTSVPDVAGLTEGQRLPSPPTTAAKHWVSGILGLRGLLVHPDDVERITGSEKFEEANEHQKYLLIRGMCAVHSRLEDLVGKGITPDGWSIVELFEKFTSGVARFRNNTLRRDMPWDSILYVNYPQCDDLKDCLDSFHLANSFTDIKVRFQNLHPVRQAFRVMWHFGRLAPFPDFNLSMSWVAMNLYLISTGYPAITPQGEDRELIHRLMTGPVPVRITPFEARLLGQCE